MLQTLKICMAPKREHDFYKIDVFEKVSKKRRFWSRFRRPKSSKIEKKLCSKHVFFLTSCFLRFFAIFCDFRRIWGVPGPSKKLQKIEKIEFLTRSFLKEGFGRVLGGFWDGFGRVLEGF